MCYYVIENQIDSDIKGSKNYPGWISQSFPIFFRQANNNEKQKKEIGKDVANLRHFVYTHCKSYELERLPAFAEAGGPEGNPLLRWAQFINSETKEEFEMVTKDDPYLKKAYERLEEVSGDPERRWEYEAREKAIRDYISMMNGSWEDGHESGEKEGYERGKNEMKRQMEQQMERQKRVWKLSMEGRLEREIAEQLGISVEEVHKILE